MLKYLTISFFGPIKKSNNNPPRISVYDNETNKNGNLEPKDCTKCLGVLIDENLSWRTHFVTVAIKISKAIGTLSKCRHFVPSSVLVNIYNALITFYLTYGLISWRNACTTPRQNTYPSKMCTTLDIFCKQIRSCYSGLFS